MFEGINILAVLVAAISAFVLGGIWYSKFLFGQIWTREAGVTKPQKGHSAMAFGLSFLLSLLAAGVFALFIGPEVSFPFAVITGFVIGLCWVASSFGINYLFAGRSWKLFLIDGGYHTLQFTLYGVVIGLWH